MSDAKIEQYLVEVRSWVRRPTDYDSVTEDIIRRILRGEITIGGEGAQDGGTSKPAELPGGQEAPGSARSKYTTVFDDE
jgi:hypothetical protein